MKYLKHYIALAAILSVGLGLFWIFNYNRAVQIWIILGLGGIYVIWGIIHHVLIGRFHLRIVGEYLTVAMLASLIIIFLLMRT